MTACDSPTIVFRGDAVRQAALTDALPATIAAGARRHDHRG
jgi:hypothetical protein